MWLTPTRVGVVPKGDMHRVAAAWDAAAAVSRVARRSEIYSVGFVDAFQTTAPTELHVAISVLDRQADSSEDPVADGLDVPEALCQVAEPLAGALPW